MYETPLLNPGSAPGANSGGGAPMQALAPGRWRPSVYATGHPFSIINCISHTQIWGVITFITVIYRPFELPHVEDIFRADCFTLLIPNNGVE